MKNEMGMVVSESVFTAKFKEKITEDIYTNPFKSGDLRGKINGKSFYFYLSEEKPKTFSTVLKGKFDDKSASYRFTKPQYTRVLMLAAALLWLAFSIVMFFIMGPRGLIALLVIPVILFPYFLKKKSEMDFLESTLKKLCRR